MVFRKLTIASLSSRSRFLICLLPLPLYLMSPAPNHRKGKINETLQAALRCIVESLHSWSSTPICGLRGEFVALKGDWKWLTQALNLRCHAGTDQICWQCPASKSIQFAYTDLSAGAAWRRSRHDPSEVHFRKPSIAELGHFNMKKVSIDWMHCFHLGLARDVVASVFVVMLRTRGIFVGGNVSLSCLNSFFGEDVNIWYYGVYVLFWPGGSQNETRLSAHQDMGQEPWNQKVSKPMANIKD